MMRLTDLSKGAKASSVYNRYLFEAEEALNLVRITCAVYLAFGGMSCLSKECDENLCRILMTRTGQPSIPESPHLAVP